MSEIILHHYPPSLVSEKVRVVLGIKGLEWRSVTIPRLPPKPDLMPLTGGYRFTPVMQIGADIYCDSQCIARELERRFPEPTLFPGGAQGIAWGVGRWTDGAMFNTILSLVFADACDDMPGDFKADRGPLYFGFGFDLDALQRKIPENLVQLRAQFGWMDERVAKRDFMLGDDAGLPDALGYYLVWFIRGRYSRGPDFLSQFKNLMEWEQRVQSIGHGNPKDLGASEALEIAKAATPEDSEAAHPDPYEPTGLAPGDLAAVEPLDVNGCPAVTGHIVRITANEIALARTDKHVGNVVVHFPRAGYLVTKI